MKAAETVRSQRPLLWCHHPGKTEVLNQRRQVFHVNKVLIPQARRPLLPGTAEHGRAACMPGQQTTGAVPGVPEADATSAGSHENVNLYTSTGADLNPPQVILP